MSDLVTIPNVEIARVGTFSLSTGQHTFTSRQLAAAVRNYEAGLTPRIGIGHVDPRWKTAGDGDPAFGRVENLRLSDDGNTIVADLVTLDWLAAAAPHAYPGRSIEGVADGDDLKIYAVKLLGTTMPGIHTLADLREAVAGDGPALVAAGADESGNTFTVLLASITPDVPEAARPQTPSKEEAPTVDVDRTLLAKRLGLSEDATDEQINNALADIVLKADEPNPVEEAAKDSDPAGEPERPASGGETEKRERVEQIDTPKTVQVSEEVWSETQTRLSTLEADARAKANQAAADRRDNLVAASLGQGKIAPSERDHYRKLLDVDEQTGTQLMASLAAGRIPVDERGHGHHVEASGDTGDDDVDTALKQMFPDVYTQEGR